MAKIEETVFLIKLSKLVKDKQDIAELGFDELPATIEEVVQQLVPADVIVEVEKAD